MTRQIETHYAEQYSSNIGLLLQQMGSKLMGCVEKGSHYGEAASPTEQVGPIVAKDAVTPGAALDLDETPADRRWVTPQDFYINPFQNTLDKLRQLVDFDSAFVRNAVMSLGRKQDDIIIDAFFGISQTGKKHEVNVEFPGSQDIADAGVGATPTKIIEGMEMLAEAEVDTEMEAVYFGISPRQNSNLLAFDQLVSKDYTGERPVLVKGKVTEFAGAMMKHSTRFGKTGNIRHNPLWAKSGMYYGEWEAINTTISQRTDLVGHPFQFYTTATGDATRLEEKKIVRINCQES